MTTRDDTRGANATILQVNDQEIVVPPGRPLRKTDRILKEDDEVYINRADITHDLEDGTTLTIPGGTGQLYPYFHTLKPLAAPIDGETHVTIQEAKTIQERMRCKSLPHYLGWSPGAYLYATLNGYGPLGAIVISRLPYHMRPKWRRNLEREWGGYREAAWIRRVSVRKDVQDRGVGTALATASLDYTRNHWLPTPQVIESIATESGHGFFLRAGFTESEESYRGRLNIVKPDGTRNREYRDRYYYWTEVDG